MNYYEEWCSENYLEEEPALELDFDQEIKSEIKISEAAILAAVDNVIKNKVTSELKKYIDREVSKCLQNHYQSKIKFEDIMYKIIKEKFEEKYPDVVENKINEFEEEIKKLKFSDRRGNYSMDSMIKSATERISQLEKEANAKVSSYINNELSKSVAKSNEYIEQFAKNYFAQNLFKAMGMMDKMMPTTENILSENHTYKKGKNNE